MKFQVVCRELGFDSANVYEWLTPRWDYNPKIIIRKNYVAPRQCIGMELKLEQCPIRMSYNLSMWQCIDNEHFNYIHCGEQTILNRYVFTVELKFFFFCIIKLGKFINFNLISLLFFIGLFSTYFIAFFFKKKNYLY